MDSVGSLLEALFTLAGPLWVVAWAAAFVSMTFESTRVKSAEGEEKSEGGPGRGIIAIASLITPFLLFVHAFYATGRAPGGLIASVAALLLLIVGSGLAGWVIGVAAPNVGRMARGVAPWLAAAVFAFTLYVTWRNVWAVLELYVLPRG